MGWYDSHLHQFIAGSTYYAVPSGEDFFDMDTRDERKVRLDQLLSRPKQKSITSTTPATVGNMKYYWRMV